jgi:aryl-alcohol dehydrogenase-like predicted oxidoreductase
MRSAGHVEWAAVRLPFSTKCLPQAMALSWMLRRKGISHQLVLAARPAHLRDSADALHAWVEVDGTKIVGDLPGPWIETLRLGG